MEESRSILGRSDTGKMPWYGQSRGDGWSGIETTLSCKIRTSADSFSRRKH